MSSALLATFMNAIRCRPRRLSSAGCRKPNATLQRGSALCMRWWGNFSTQRVDYETRTGHRILRVSPKPPRWRAINGWAAAIRIAAGAAVNAMRIMLNLVNIDGTIVIGEGEIDEAPMLYIGEKVGTGKGRCGRYRRRSPSKAPA